MADHPITPPQGLVNQWRIQAPVARDGGAIREQWIATQAARWGADQRLEAIRQLLEINGCPSKFIDLIINARRPKPPSLKVRIAEAIAKGDKHQALHLLDEALSDD